jgi:hypothetical protein
MLVVSSYIQFRNMLRKTGIILTVLLLAGSLLNCNKWLTSGGDNENQEQEEEETSESIAVSGPAVEP